MYAKNISTFLLNLVKDKQVQINLEDEIIRDTLIARDGQVVNPRIQQLLGASDGSSHGVPWNAPCRIGRSNCTRCVARTLRRKDKSNDVA